MLLRLSNVPLRTQSRTARILLACGGVLLVALAWLYLAPSRIGGPVSYVITTGSSMEPGLHDGDLVIVKKSDYGIGDVVAFENRDLGGAIVLHRILKRNGDSYVFKGDNNDFSDPFEPSEEELVGEMWARVPGGGRILQALRIPRNAALLSAGLVLMAVGGVSAREKRHGRGAHARSERPTREQHVPGRLAGARHTLAVASMAGLALFGALAVISFGRPLERSAPATVAYRQSGLFSYSSEAPIGPAYDGALTTGDPVFLRLVKRIDVTFDYRFESPAIDGLTGTGSMVAELQNTNGWHRSVDIVSGGELDGHRLTLTGELDLDRVRELIAGMEQATGVTSESYQLVLEPDVTVEGTVDGTTFRDDFTPTLPFLLDELQLQRPPATAGGADPESALSTAEPGGVRVTRTEPNRLEAGAVSVQVADARLAAVAGAAVCMLLLLICGIPILVTARSDEPSRINARYGPWLVPMRSVSGPGAAVAEVSDMDALAKVAERYDRPILHEHKDGRHRYIVEGDGMIYFYRSEEERTA